MLSHQSMLLVNDENYHASCLDGHGRTSCGPEASLSCSILGTSSGADEARRGSTLEECSYSGRWSWVILVSVPESPLLRHYGIVLVQPQRPLQTKNEMVGVLRNRSQHLPTSRILYMNATL